MKENDKKQKTKNLCVIICNAPHDGKNLPMQTTNVRKKGNGMIKKLTYKHL
jgi:hypothetical protein